MQIARLGALALSLSLIGCGDDGPTQLIDSGIGNTDAAPRVCSTALSFPGTWDFYEEGESGYISFITEVSGTLADGTDVVAVVEFYPGAPITGTVDLATGVNANYSTCTTCVRAFAGTQQAPRQFLHRAGTVTFTEDPIVARAFRATITGLVLEEVNIDPENNFTSTPLPNGDCANLPDSTVDVDDVPNSYTCDAATYDAGGTGSEATCNCQCGLYDPDCSIVDATVDGCSANQACAYEETAGTQCVTPPANDTCATAPTALTLGTAVDGTTVGAQNHYDNGLADCTGYDFHPGDDVVYQVALTQGVNYSFQLTTTTDLAVAVVGPGAAGTVCVADPGEITTCVVGADEENDTGETFTYTPTTTGTYFVIVDSFSPFVAAPFSLTVSQVQ